jgi:hypothetical protein
MLRPTTTLDGASDALITVITTNQGGLATRPPPAGRADGNSLSERQRSSLAIGVSGKE